jgi:hypothetical protein
MPQAYHAAPRKEIGADEVVKGNFSLAEECAEASYARLLVHKVAVETQRAFLQGNGAVAVGSGGKYGRNTQPLRQGRRR